MQVPKVAIRCGHLLSEDFVGREDWRKIHPTIVAFGKDGKVGPKRMPKLMFRGSYEKVDLAVSLVSFFYVSQPTHRHTCTHNTTPTHTHTQSHMST